MFCCIVAMAAPGAAILNVDLNHCQTGYCTQLTGEKRSSKTAPAMMAEHSGSTKFGTASALWCVRRGRGGGTTRLGPTRGAEPGFDDQLNGGGDGPDPL